MKFRGIVEGKGNINKMTETLSQRIKEKYIQKRPLKYKTQGEYDTGICPYCRKAVNDTYNYCPQCAQHLKWD